MTYVIPFVLVALAAIALLVGAGREARALHGRPTHVRGPAALRVLVREGWTALNEASAASARLRMTRDHW